MDKYKFHLVDELPNSRVGPHGARLLEAFAAELKANPGKWGAWPKPHDSPGEASACGAEVRLGHKDAFPLNEFEATVREGKLWVRYLE